MILNRKKRVMDSKERERDLKDKLLLVEEEEMNVEIILYCFGYL